MIKLKNISFKYDKQTPVLKDFNLSIKEGEMVAIQGKSGLGKSTILRLIAGLEKVDSGKIYLDEKCINDLPTNQRNVGYVFQNHALFPHLTIRKNIAYGLFKFSASKRKELVEEVSRKLSIQELLDRYPHEISGGQKQRVAIARSLVTKPKVLLLDEPFTGLDPDLKKQIRIDIKKILSSSNITSVLVTHDIEDAKALGARIVII